MSNLWNAVGRYFYLKGDWMTRLQRWGIGCAGLLLVVVVLTMVSLHWHWLQAHFSGNPVVLRRLMDSDSDESIRLAALTKLDDPELLGRLALQEQDVSVCASIVDRLTDPAVLSQLASEREDDQVGRKAAAQLKVQAVSDVNTLNQWALGHEDSYYPQSRCT